MTDVRGTQIGVYAVGSEPAASALGSQIGAYGVGAAETSNGQHDMLVHQLGAYALVKSYPDRRDLRAWYFPQDDHDFYVLQLGDTGTLVYDKTTKQWVKWVSPDEAYWRGADGCDWEGFNICCDPQSGKIWKIDPVGRLDYETTPIRSQVTSMISKRFRNYTPCFMAELAVSESNPPSGIDASTVGISLRTYDHAGTDIVDHGEVTGTAIGEDITVRWYGLGLMKPPGTVFEIVDTGYARRINGFNIEVGNDA